MRTLRPLQRRLGASPAGADEVTVSVVGRIERPAIVAGVGEVGASVGDEVEVAALVVGKAEAIYTTMQS